MTKYNIFLRTLHWLLALMVISLLIVGFTMEDLNDGDTKWFVYKMHKSFGLSVLFLIVLRFFVRLRSSIPPLPDIISALEKRLSLWGHYILYVLVFLMAFSGASMSLFAGRGLVFFSDPFWQNLNNDSLKTIFKFVHVNLPWVLVGVILLHVAATVKHYVKDKVNLLTRII